MTQKIQHKPISDNDKSAGLPEIIGGGLTAVTTFFVGMGLSHKKHMLENGFAYGETLNSVQDKLEGLNKEIEVLDKFIMRPENFFNPHNYLDFKSNRARDNKISDLKCEYHDLNGSYQNAFESVKNDIPLMIAGAFVAAVAVGTGIYMIRKHGVKPYEQSVSAVEHHGAVNEGDKKIEPSI